MKQLLIIYSLCLFGVNAISQSKTDLIAKSPLDSVVTYEGTGPLFKGNCLFIKFSGNPQLFFNELAKFHVQNEKQVERTKQTLKIYDTTKPYWVYGRYSVFASIQKKEGYALIEIYFKAYNNPENYRMYGAAEAYQNILNHLLKNKR